METVISECHLIKSCAALLWCLLVLSFPSSYLTADSCQLDPPSSKCRCSTQSGVVIDLSPLSDISTQPLFSNVTGVDKSLYSYKPCSAMNEPVNCQSGVDPCCGVAACQNQDKHLFNLGDWNNPVFRGEPGTDNFYIEYSHMQDGTKRTTYVYLKCSNSAKQFTAQGELPDKKTFYSFTLATKYACTSSAGLSIGSILLIVFFVLLIVYIVGGVIFLRVVRGARGLEQIPNYEFWTDFPGLVKDGTMFVLRGCKADSATYDQI